MNDGCQGMMGQDGEFREGQKHAEGIIRVPDGGEFAKAMVSNSLKDPSL